jgi:hypothetical protein
MSLTHLHLLVNHVPIIGSAIAVVLLAWALLARSRELQRAGLLLVVVCGLAGFVAKQTGEEAEEQIESLPWAQKELIHEHEEAADKATIVMLIAGIAGAVALVRMRKEGAARAETIATTVVAAAGFALMAWTGFEGGHIRHEEIRPGFVLPASAEHDD